MSDYSTTKSRIFQWVGIVLVLAVFAGAYWYFKVYGSTLNAPQNDLNTNGLVGMWSFNGDDMSGTTAYDRGTGGNNGTLTNGPVVTTGKVGQGISFDGTDDYVEIPNLADMTAVTLSAWVKISADVTDPDAEQIISRDGSSHGSGRVWQFRVNDDEKVCAIFFNTVPANSSCATSASAVRVNVWHHAVATFDGATIITYLDGIAGTPVAFSGPLQTADSPIWLARNAPSDGTPFSGSIDEVRIYNRAIGAGEVVSLYSQGGGTKANTSISQPQGTGRLDSGLAGYWKLDDGSGTSATDASTNGNTGTLTSGPTWTTGQIGGAVDFDGTDDYIAAGDQSMFEVNPNSISIGGWFKLDALPSGNRMFLVTKGGTTSYYEYELNVNGANSNKIRFTLGAIGGGAYLSTDSITAPTTGVWFHVVGVFDMNALSAKVYYNGVLEGTSTSTSGTIESTKNSNFNIGKRDDSAEAELNGQADEVRVYNRALSGDEVGQLYRLNSPTSVDTSLKGYWSFNGQDVSGTTAYDRSGAGNNGTLTNSPTEVVGKNGQALGIVASSSYVTIPDSTSLSPTAAFTLSFWIRPTVTVTGSEKTLILKSETSQRTFHVQSTSAAAVKFNVASSIGDSGSNYGVSPDGVIVQNQWTHVTTVFDGAGSGNSGRAKIYINGVEQPVTYTGTIAATVPNATSPLVIGSLLTAAYDEVRFYDRAFTAAEIKGLYDVGQSDKTNSSASQPQGTGRLDSGLAGYWKLDEGTGTTATDSSANGNNGTVPNSWTTGQVGSAVSFDGSNSMSVVAGTGVLDAKQNVTLAAWVYPRANGSYRSWFYKGVSGCDEGTAKYMLENDVAGYLKLWIGGSSLASTYTLATNQWQHIVATNSASGSAIYVNGILVASGSGLAAPSSSSENWLFNACNRIDANMDEIRIYDRALPIEEIAQLYRLTAPTGADTGLKGYWSFNGQDVSGTTAYDRSGAGNNGTLTNGPTKVIGKIGQALNFDMVDDYVNAGSAASLDDLGPLSISVWINPNSIGEGSFGRIIGKNGAISAGGWYVSLVTGNPCIAGGATLTNSIFFSKLGATAAARSMRCSGDNAVDFNVWQHIVITWDGSAGFNGSSGVNIYKNGVETPYSTVSATSDAASSDATLDLVIGNRPAADRTFDGEIDEVRIYNRVLTAAEAATLYNQGR